VFFHASPIYQAILAYTSSAVEAGLGVPQFMLNYKRQNTSGLSIALILIWLGGDLYKLQYYVTHGSPLALQGCAMFQILTDLCILCQFAIYRDSGDKKKGKSVSQGDNDDSKLISNED
jgi:solute carrier family 66, member 2